MARKHDASLPFDSTPNSGDFVGARHGQFARTGAVLSGGLSSRMGSPKQFLRLPDGRMMIDHVIDALAGVCQRILIVGSGTDSTSNQSNADAGTSAASPSPQPSPLREREVHSGQVQRYASIPDLRPHAGPLGGIEALLASGIDAPPGGAGQYLICPCDVPLITPAVLSLLAQPSDSPATVFRIEGRDEIEPLPARIGAEALPAVRRMLKTQHRSVWRLMKELQPCIITITARQALQLHNVNTIGDFNEALRLMANASLDAGNPGDPGNGIRG